MSTDNDSTGPLRILDHPAAIDATARIIAGARRRSIACAGSSVGCWSA